MIKKIFLISSLFLSLTSAASSSVSSDLKARVEKSEAIEAYRSPDSTSAEIARAIVIFEKYSNDDPKMLYYYGLANIEGKTELLELDDKIGYNYIEQAAVKGDVDAKYEFAIYQMKTGRLDSGLASLKESALKNQKNAQYTLGKMFYQGNGVPKNKNNGFNLIKLSAEQEHPEAQYDLAKIYFAQSSQEVQKGGVHWLNKAVSNQNYKACDDLYKIYNAGILVDQDMKKHLKYLNCSALNDNSDAQMLLGSYYLHGKYVTKDPHAANIWYTKLKEKKDPEGIYQVAVYNLKFNNNKARVMQETIASLEANSREHLDSANLIAEIYMKGLYKTQRSFTTAITHLERAKNLGDPDAQSKIIYLLSEEDKIRKAKKQ